MRDIRQDKLVKLEPCEEKMTTAVDVYEEAENVNWRSDGEKGEHLWQRRLAMGQVMDYCCGLGIDVGCQANKIVPNGAAGGNCVGIDHDHRKVFMDPGSRWTCDMFGDGLNLGNPDSSIDWVFAGHVLEYQPFPVGTLKMLREFWRVVKNGGYIVLLMPHKRYYPNVGDPEANPAHQRDWLPEELLQFVNGNLYKELRIVQLESFYNKFEFDAVFRVVKDDDNGRTR